MVNGGGFMNEAWWVDEADLDEDQRKIISLGPEGSHTVIGPPGSGKTNSLLLRANYICKAGKPNVLILVFTRPLKEFISAGASRYLFSPQKIKTYHGWAYQILSENGIEIKKHTKFEQERQFLLEQLQQLVEAEKITHDYYDVILLDEAHDYLVPEIEVLKKFTNNIFAVADNRQQIYRKGTETVDYLGKITDTIELKYHYRNGLHICRLADNIMKGKKQHAPLEPTSQYDEKSRPSSVKHFRCSNIDEQCKLIEKEIQTQLMAYPEEMIGIICPRHEELEEIKEFLIKSSIQGQCIFQDNESGYLPFEHTQPICVSTLHGAKGLEFRTLHIAACDTLKKFYQTNRSMIFTGVTRAKTSLSLYYCDELYGYIESALASLSPRSSLPRISEAFGKDK